MEHTERPLPYDMDPQRAARAVERHNARLAESLPLFAMSGQLETVAGQEVWTVDSVLHEWKTHNQAVQDLRIRQTARAIRMRAEVAERVSADRLQELDAQRWKLYPQSAEFSADFWWRKLKEIEPGHPLLHGGGQDG